VREVEVNLSWGDYVTVPPLNNDELLNEKADAPEVVWDRVPGSATLRGECPRQPNADYNYCSKLRRRAAPVWWPSA
jgi:hypothetical protein